MILRSPRLAPSSTSLKAVVYDLSGNVIASGNRPTERFHPDPAHPDWTVWDPAQIWNGAAAAVKEAVSRLDDPGAIAAVAVTGMGMDGVPMDEKGAWLYPFISWLCPRTEPQLQWWEKNIGAEKNFSIGGNTVWRYSTALRLLWMAEHEPEILSRTKKWLLIEDFLNFMLCLFTHKLKHFMPPSFSLSIPIYEARLLQLEIQIC